MRKNILTLFYLTQFGIALNTCSTIGHIKSHDILYINVIRFTGFVVFATIGLHPYPLEDTP